MRARLVIAIFLIAVPVTAAADNGRVRHDAAETRLVSALEQIRSGQQQRAAETLRTLIDARPDFKLAHFLYGQLLTSNAGDAVATAERPGAEALLMEARQRWRHHQTPPPPGAIPNAILHLASRHEHAIVADLLDNRLYLFRNDNGRPRLQADFYASIGSAGAGKRFEGDLRTPVGIYHVNGFKPDSQLPELYGDGALTLNYPNAWDRHSGRTGYGIWLHGVPRTTFNRPPRASEGCVVLANRDLELLREHLQDRATPVVFTDELRWLTPDEARARRDALVAAVAKRQRQQRSGRAKALQVQYADTLASVARVASRTTPDTLGSEFVTTPVGADLKDVSIYAYPGEPGLMMTTLADDKATDDGRETLFWRRLPGVGWRIVPIGGRDATTG